ncbi:MAG: 3-oxoacyl-[acyl-carrier-protein] reductase [Actinomycetia bacterium]|nr:3-oxoacyl-[acyl-carrier-protein] reductase [Actinomycetes bacterium]
MKLKGKVSLITGAARGLGAAIAYRLAEEGSTVFINDLKTDSLTWTYRKLKKINNNCYMYAADITDKTKVKDMFSYIFKKENKIDILVNNAGITKDSFFHKMKDSDWQKVIDVNIGGMYNCTRAAIEDMRNNNYGRIMNISSVVGISGNMGQTNYAASKAAVIGFTKALALESAARNITVNAIAPGFIETDMTKVIPEKIKEKIIAKIPAGRFGKPEDIASIVAYLSKDEANYITGQVISVNGGFLT